MHRIAVAVGIGGNCEGLDRMGSGPGFLEGIADDIHRLRAPQRVLSSVTTTGSPRTFIRQASSVSART
jgi:hypothetical protein